MIFNCGSDAEDTGRIFPKIIDKFILKSFADETGDESNEENKDTDNEDNSNSNEGTLNYEDLISRARQQERQKQYNKIEKLNNTNQTLVEQHNADLLKIAELEKMVEELNKKVTDVGSSDSEAVTTLKKELEEVTKEKDEALKKIKEFEDVEIVDRDAIEKEIRENLEEEYKVKTHRMEVLSEHKDDLLVPELVFGNTIEEIDASLEKALNRSNEIREKIGAENPIESKTDSSKKPKSGSPSVLDNKEITVDYVASLDPASPEYAEFRKKMGLA